jgi:hypothetical protein
VTGGHLSPRSLAPLIVVSPPDPSEVVSSYAEDEPRNNKLTR